MKVQNPFPYTNDNKRYHTWNYHLRNEVCEKAVPLYEQGIGYP
ncbi:TIGR01212 family radical SAM protein, partial [Bacillus sp. HC-Mk]